jgi:hypothetical protein
VAVCLALVGGLWWWGTGSRGLSGDGTLSGAFGQSREGTAERGAFPDIDTAGLGPTQAALAQVLREQYDQNQPGTVYSDGVEENWCADFVSWVYREAGASFSNPNSGSWRIPGVLTLWEYFRSQGQFTEDLAGFTPQFGDVVLYEDVAEVGQHTNIVLSFEDGWITTVGGNEGKPAQVRVSRARLDDPSLGIIGIGRPLG